MEGQRGVYPVCEGFGASSGVDAGLRSEMGRGAQVGRVRCRIGSGALRIRFERGLALGILESMAGIRTEALCSGWQMKRVVRLDVFGALCAVRGIVLDDSYRFAVKDGIYEVFARPWRIRMTGGEKLWRGRYSKMCREIRRKLGERYGDFALPTFEECQRAEGRIVGNMAIMCVRTASLNGIAGFRWMFLQGNEYGRWKKIPERNKLTWWIRDTEKKPVRNGVHCR